MEINKFVITTSIVVTMCFTAMTAGAAVYSRTHAPDPEELIELDDLSGKLKAEDIKNNITKIEEKIKEADTVLNEGVKLKDSIGNANSTVNASRQDLQEELSKLNQSLYQYKTGSSELIEFAKDVGNMSYENISKLSGRLEMYVDDGKIVKAMDEEIRLCTEAADILEKEIEAYKTRQAELKRRAAEAERNAAHSSSGGGTSNDVASSSDSYGGWDARQR